MSSIDRQILIIRSAKHQASNMPKINCQLCTAHWTTPNAFPLDACLAFPSLLIHPACQGLTRILLKAAKKKNNCLQSRYPGRCLIRKAVLFIGSKTNWTAIWLFHCFLFSFLPKTLHLRCMLHKCTKIFYGVFNFFSDCPSPARQPVPS